MTQADGRCAGCRAPVATSDHRCPACGLDLERWAQGGQAVYRNPATGATLEEKRGDRWRPPMVDALAAIGWGLFLLASVPVILVFKLGGLTDAEAHRYDVAALTTLAGFIVWVLGCLAYMEDGRIGRCIASGSAVVYLVLVGVGWAAFDSLEGYPWEECLAGFVFYAVPGALLLLISESTLRKHSTRAAT